MVLTRAGAKTLAVERRRQCIVVNEEAEDPSIPDLVPRRRGGPRPDNLWLSQQEALRWHRINKRSWRRGKRRRPSGILRRGVRPLSRRLMRADHNSKRIKVTIPRPPPHHKQLDNQSKGSSSTSLIGDKDANAERGPDGALTLTVCRRISRGVHLGKGGSEFPG
ncbi:hypothetical protein SESBI_49354 [Sesbania bispinosa]|nr:hypothetical protein SESBI_49354 [Sesbania bispinosa]